MNTYIISILHQLEVANETIVKIIESLHGKPIDEHFYAKRSIRELLSHLSTIYVADYLIMNGATREGMQDFYQQNTPHSLEEIQHSLQLNFQYFKTQLSLLSEAELFERTTSYWGVTYSRFEWLIEIVAHIYHHRGQLHSMLVEKGIDLKMPLFE